ncbi:hypothetical protein [Streptomyces caniscabiei]|uniref:hypothetical protein n=1 Tax=Streptomyces caniscabiei TaxID=2746961 RepID=UPI001F3B7F3A|nr:hypothetical protein [Streptomyces caniscabiei]
MTQDELRHPALTGAPWPVIGVRVRREDNNPRAASWRPAPHAVPEDVLLPCTWPELERLAEIATGRSRARVYVRALGDAGPEQRLVLCLRGAPGAVRAEGPSPPSPSSWPPGPAPPRCASPRYTARPAARKKPSCGAPGPARS